MTDQSQPEWYRTLGQTLNPSEPPKPVDLESLERKNQACLAKRHLNRVQTTIKAIDKQIQKLENGRVTLTSIQTYLSYYQHSMEEEGPVAGYPQQEWFPLLEMVLKLFDVLSKGKVPDEAREGLEGHIIDSFLTQVGEVGLAAGGRLDEGE